MILFAVEAIVCHDERRVSEWTRGHGAFQHERERTSVVAEAEGVDIGVDALRRSFLAISVHFSICNCKPNPHSSDDLPSKRWWWEVSRECAPTREQIWGLDSLGQRSPAKSCWSATSMPFGRRSA